ncbi:hypothetical protein [Clostridium saccharobutylicum]|uniref:Uncharacterized protein n=1 Tax=Clostridium saccharobutylicum DSM 13864 TaxID=1345695 RepID=U5MXT9_CLOSA|nr:hypothetical protein [Clostridium saccharobutylicum]AGX44426.1 hypothetical protein CLSA_c34640 [Clostridium saccharobutylicum DSM 13864]NOV78948.1 hypothetical protein [Clostridium saccharobutylicum]NSB94957.1 hypothetical protein [Clostridium saccharobutylicum]
MEISLDKIEMNDRYNNIDEESLVFCHIMGIWCIIRLKLMNIK